MRNATTRVDSIMVRLEGCVNQVWLFNYSDGTQEEFYAIEESPRYGDGALADHFVHESDMKLHLFLTSLVETASAGAPQGYDEDEDVLEVTFNEGMRVTSSKVIV